MHLKKDYEEMKIAIHHTPGTFSDRWIEYCINKGIDYKLVDCYESDIVNQLNDCDALMWHFHHGNYKDALFARQLLFSIEQSGKKTFPNSKTCWHFDDKIGQKYLFESLGLPLVPSYVFYTKKEANQWIKNASFPKVFKLRSGAGSVNVRLVKSATQAKRLTKRAFSSGFSQFNRIEHLKEKTRLYREGRCSKMGVFKAFGRLIIATEWATMRGKEKGYVYFQDFIPNNHFDIRVVVINDKAFGAKRIVRDNDFRASGSGRVFYEKEHIPTEMVRLAFELSDKLQTQSTAFDFIYNEEGKPMILEMSFGFPTKAASACTGYWDKKLQFHEGPFHPEYWMVEAMISKPNELILKKRSPKKEKSTGLKLLI